MVCLSVNLGYRSELCCTRLAENTGRKKSPFGRHHITLSDCIFATKASIDNRKILVKQQYLLHMSSQYDELLYIYFRGLFPPDGILPVQNSLYVQVLRSPILAALLHGTPTADVSQTLRCGTKNGITELSQTAPPIFRPAAITLGIGPHSS